MRVRVGDVITWTRPLVSALMVTRNRGALARLNVEAFLRDRWRWKELIIIDDSDRPVDLESSATVKQIKLEPGAGMGMKHNMALDHAQGDVLAYWDDDDIFRDHRLTYQIEPIINDHADVTGLERGYIFKLPHGTFYKFNHKQYPAGQWMGNGKVIGGVRFHDGTAMFRRDLIKGVRHPEWLISQKLQFLSELIENGARPLAMENHDAFVYVRHQTNTWKFREDLRLDPVDAPKWIPTQLVDAYRGVKVG